MEKELKGIVAANNVPADLIVTCHDMHGLWGGKTITARGGGSVEREPRVVGARPKSKSRGSRWRSASS